MQIKVFTISIHDSKEANEELNRFLRGYRILEVEQQLVQSREQHYWVFCVRYLESSKGGGTQKAGRRQRKDYKELLSGEDFARFSKLRRIRKQIAQEDGVPAFAVFTDEELAGLAALGEFSPAQMRTVKGIGEKRTEKYAVRFITALQNEESE